MECHNTYSRFHQRSGLRHQARYGGNLVATYLNDERLKPHGLFLVQDPPSTDINHPRDTITWNIDNAIIHVVQ